MANEQKGVPLFAHPLKQKVFVALRKAGLLEPRVHFPWIMDLTDREAIKVLKELGQHIKPVAKEIGKGGLKMLGPLGAAYSLLESKPLESGFFLVNFNEKKSVVGSLSKNSLIHLVAFWLSLIKCINLLRKICWCLFSFILNLLFYYC